MKRKFSFVFLAVVSAVLLPLAATSQIAPDRPARTEKAEPSYKWEAFAGVGYTALNQVARSENGLIGMNLSVTRDFGNHFGLTADGGYYAQTYDASNPGNPTVDVVLLGPVLRFKLFDRVDGFAHMLLGGAHTAGDSSVPKLSFAGGGGGGLDYKLSPHLAIRASGDDIASSFVQDPNNLGYSPHLRRNARAAFGVVYRF
ncbi:MAG: hypothetical protein ABSB60_03725 [Terracidiphilus sp.]